MASADERVPDAGDISAACAQFEAAISSGDPQRVRKALFACRPSLVLRARWDRLIEFARAARGGSGAVVSQMLLALKERVTLERQLYTLVGLVAARDGAADTGPATAFPSPGRLPPLQDNSRRYWVEGDATAVGIAKGSGTYYKTVAVYGGRYWNVFDGTTEYPIGTTVYRKFTSDRSSGIFVYKTLRDAILASFPSESTFLGKRRVVLKVKASGGVRVIGNKLSFELIKPVDVVCELPRSKRVVTTALLQLSGARRGDSRAATYRSFIQSSSKRGPASRRRAIENGTAR